VCEIDLRPGGAWRYVMHCADGQKMAMSGVYREIERPERLVYTESFDDYPGETINTGILTEEDGKDHLHGNDPVRVQGASRRRARVGDAARRRGDVRPSRRAPGLAPTGRVAEAAS
jgi:uncharacterized protein YndB with AHSA1/START domain